MDISKIANYQKKERKEWKNFYGLTRTVFLRDDLKKELNYPVLCSSKNRSAIYRKNVDDVYKCLDDVANELVRFGNERAGKICTDVIFSALFLMINTFDRLDYYSEDHDGWNAYKIKHHENVQAMITMWKEKYFEALMSPVIDDLKKAQEMNLKKEEITKELDSFKKKLNSINEELVVNNRILENKKLELQRTAIIVNTNISNYKSVIEENQNRIKEINGLVIELEKQILEKEKARSSVSKRKEMLQETIKQDKKQYEDAINQFDVVEEELKREIEDSTLKLSKALLLKRSKKTQLDNLHQALQRQLEEKAKLENQFIRNNADHNKILEDYNTKCMDFDTSIADLQQRADTLRKILKTSEFEIERIKKEYQRIHHEYTQKCAEVAAIEEAIQTKNEETANLNIEVETLNHKLNVIMDNLRKIGDAPITLLEQPTIDIMQHQSFKLKKSKVPSPLQKVIESTFERYLYLRTELLELKTKQIDYNTRKRVYTVLSSDIDSISCPNNLITDLKKINLEICRINSELNGFVPYVGFANMMDNVSGKVNGFLKKVNRSFESFWKKTTTGGIIPYEFFPFSTEGHCLNVNDDIYLWFNPFYVLYIKVDKKNMITVNVLQYSDLSLNLCETNIALKYGQECPKGATIVAERWQYENANGTKNLRYKTNNKYYIVSVHTLKINTPNDEMSLYYFSGEDAGAVFSAFQSHRAFLKEDCGPVIEEITSSSEIPNVISIYEKVIETQKMKIKAQKEQERKRIAHQKEELRKREEKKKQEEQHRISLENWVIKDREIKKADAIILEERKLQLQNIDQTIIENWESPPKPPVVITNTNRNITNGIIKIGFLHNPNDAATKYIVLFVTKTGDKCSDARIIKHDSVETSSKIPFEINTNVLNDAKSVYLLMINYETLAVVDCIEFNVNITFTNDFGL